METQNRTWPSRILRPLRAFGYSQFSLLWGASVLSIMSFFMTQLVRGWLILDLTDSPFLVTAVQGVAMLPMLIFPLFGGVLADRVNRRLVLILADFGNLLGLLILIGLLFSGLVQVWHVFALSLVSGITFGLIQPTRAASVPDVVDSRDMANGVALFTTIYSTSQLSGSALAGYLMSINPEQLGWAFLGTAVLVLCGIGLLIPLRLPTRRDLTNLQENSSVFASIKEGVVYIKGKDLLFATMVLAVVFAGFAAPYQTLLPVIARDILNAGPDGLGWLAGFGAFGSIGGAVTVAVLNTPQQMKLLMIGAAVMFGVLLVWFGVSTLFAMSLVLAMGLGYLTQVFMVSNFTMTQVISSAHIRGRVLGVRYFLMGMRTPGIFLVGFIAETVGPGAALSGMGITGILLIVLCAIGLRGLRENSGYVQVEQS
jgi:Na+/melibiose symporter-like transporter